MDFVIGYFEKMKLALLIESELKENYNVGRADSFKEAELKLSKEKSKLWGDLNVVQYEKRKIKSLHGILERNIKTVETEEGFDLYVPKAYGEEYVEKCIKRASRKWLQELTLKGKVTESETD